MSKSRLNNGSVIIITGPMRCGKSEELLRRIKRFKIAERNVLLFKPDIDNRFSEDEVVSRDDRRSECIIVPASDPSYIYSFISDYSDVIAIDEAQFFKKYDTPLYENKKENIVDVVQNLSDRGHTVLIAGLDMTSERKPFNYMPELMAIADEVLKLKAVCSKCRQEKAIYTSANFKKSTDIVVGDESYDALCRRCWLKKNKKN